MPFFLSVLFVFFTTLLGCVGKNADERVERLEAQMINQHILEMRINHAEERLETLEQRVGGQFVAPPKSQVPPQPKYAPPIRLKSNEKQLPTATQMPVQGNMPLNTVAGAQPVSSLGEHSVGLSATPSLSFSTPPSSIATQVSAGSQPVPVVEQANNNPSGAAVQKTSEVEKVLHSLQETQQNEQIFDPNRPVIPAGARIVLPNNSSSTTSGTVAQSKTNEAKKIQDSVSKNSPASSHGGLAQYKTGQTDYDAALAIYEQKHYAQAYMLFENFGQKNPNSKLLPNVYYWQGECQYSLKQFAQSILLFKDVVSKYPKHAKSADALLKLGLAYKELSDSENARFYWEILVEDYPQTRAAKLARQYLAALS